VDAIVFGAGAVGLGLASALLAAGGARVHIVARPAVAAALRANGLVRSGLFGDVRFPAERLDVAEDAAALAGSPAAFVLVATKAGGGEAAAAALARCRAVGPRTRLVLCQNGWGNAERFRELFPAAQVWNARVITGFRKLAAHHVDVTVHAEPVRIGSLFGEPATGVAPLCAALAKGGIPCEPSDTIAADLWAKLLYNAALNPLGALLGASYGALGASPETRGVLEALARETFAVMEAAGHATHWPSADAWLADLYARLLPPTAAHESSMLQDIRAGRRTEIDAISGAVVALAQRHGVGAPVNESLLTLVRHLEARGTR
jgi:2-dehydropantoate 2-reductase